MMTAHTVSIQMQIDSICKNLQKKANKSSSLVLSVCHPLHPIIVNQAFLTQK